MGLIVALLLAFYPVLSRGEADKPEADPKKNKAIHCHKIYSRDYIDLIYKCYKLNPQKHFEFFCKYSVVNEIFKRIKYCEEQEGYNAEGNDLDKKPW